MGDEVDHHHDDQAPLLPTIEFSNKCLAPKQERGSEEWRATSNKVRKACEDYGCFLLLVPEETMPKRLRDDMAMAMKALFDLPEETKRKHKSSMAYHSYQGKCDMFPLLQSFGIDNVTNSDAVESFTNLMWPQENSSFCETMKSMTAKMELNFTILEMLFETLGVPNHFTTHVNNTSAVMRIMKYEPPSNDEADVTSAIGLPAHTDKGFITILRQNDVHGLEILTKGGEWVRVEVPERAAVVLVGDSLRAWSNGRLHAVRHRVVMSSEEEVKGDRYSFAMIGAPKEGFVIEVPDELVDDDEHRLRYRGFRIGEYVKYFMANHRDDALEAFAGV